MFHTQSRDSETVQKRQTRRLLEISARGDDIPICPSSQPEESKEAWLNRFCTLPEAFRNIFEQIYNFDVLPDDVYVVTFPKSGTTWIQEATWLLLNDLDYETACRKHLINRSIFMDLSALYSEIPRNTVALAKELKSPRLIKSHLPANLIPHQIWQQKAKIVYCARNPKDVIVSYYHFHKGIGTWSGSLEEFVDDFINNDIMYTPFWPNILDFWRMRHEPNVFFTTYEEMKRDLPKVLRNLCSFLERPPLSEEQLATLVDHLSFDKMKNNDQTNPTSFYKEGSVLPRVLPDFQFMREGKVGAYKEDLTPELEQRLNKWTESCLQGYHVTTKEIFGEI